MSDGVAAATYAVVIDTWAEIIPTSNRGRAVRLLMTQENAEALWNELGKLLG